MEDKNNIKTDEYGRRIQSARRLKTNRRVIGDLMRQSLDTIPQASPYFELAVDKLWEAKDELKKQNRNVTITSLFVRIMATVLRDYPYMNTAVIDGQLVTYDSCNVGFGVGLESSIINVVIKEAQDKNIFEISDEMKEKTQKVKEGTLPMEEMYGSTFTISSIGVQGIRYSTVIINPPETCMLAIGVAEKRLVVDEDDSIHIRRIMGFGLTHNHILFDGYHIGVVIDMMRERLNNPMDYMGL
mgnify:CR=1 FL=1